MTPCVAVLPSSQFLLVFIILFYFFYCSLLKSNIIVNMMNNYKKQIPSTPNLEDLKKHPKSKSRKKQNYSNAPTPKPTKQSTHHFDQYVPANRCSEHPDRFMTHCQRKACKKCVLLQSQGYLYDDESKIMAEKEKKKCIEEFRKRIEFFGGDLEMGQRRIQQFIDEIEVKVMENDKYIRQNFSRFRQYIDQKERELLNDLICCQQNLKKSLTKGQSQIQDMISAINRYQSDIDRNYKEIIEQLSFSQFDEIIHQYNKKINYFQDEFNKIMYFGEENINIYIPCKDLEKVLAKASVRSYEDIEFDSKNKQLGLQKMDFIENPRFAKKNRKDRYNETLPNSKGKHYKENWNSDNYFCKE